MFKLLGPYALYLLVYIIYVLYVFNRSFDNTFDDEETGFNDLIHLVITAILCVLSFYFLRNESKSLR